MKQENQFTFKKIGGIIGPVELATFCVILLLYVGQYYLFSVVLAFAFGVGLTYSLVAFQLQKVTPKIKNAQIEADGIATYMQDFPLIELLLLLFATWFYLMKFFMLSGTFAFVFGIGLTFLIQKARPREEQTKKAPLTKKSKSRSAKKGPSSKWSKFN